MMEHRDYFKEDEYWKRHIHRKLEPDMWIESFRHKLPQKGRALDLGCGIGQYTRWLMEHGFRVISADISRLALEETGKINPNTIHLDMREKLPFEDESLDVVFANLSIHYFSDAVTKALLKEIRRILAPNGIFVGSVNAIQGYEFMPDSAEELEHHYYWSVDRYIRLFDIQDLQQYLSCFANVEIEERETVRFENKKNYLIFLCEKPPICQEEL